MLSARKKTGIQAIATTVLFTGLYFALTIALAPVSYLPFQVRVSDVLIVMSAVVGLPAVYGVFFGCILANLFPVGYPANPVDVVAGSLANLIASYSAYKIAYQRSEKLRIVAATLISTLIVTFIVGSYLPFIILPEVSWIDVLWIGYLGVLPGELISQMVLGIPTIMTIQKLIHTGQRRT